jgi:RNA polymerase sigma-B factor
VEEHLQLVRPIALSFARRSGQSGDDLIQVGMLGLIKASSTYTVGSSVPFQAFARPHIRGAILHYLRDRSALIRLPRRVEEQAQQLCRQPIDQLEARDQLLVARYRNKTRWCELTDVAADSHQDQLVDLMAEDRRIQVRAAMDALPANERKAIVQVVLEGDSLRTVARDSGVSAMTIQRRVKRGLGSLSTALREAQLSD